MVLSYQQLILDLYNYLCYNIYYMKSLEIRRVVDDVDIKHLRRFMLAQPQFYPDHNDWIDEKCLPRIEEGRAVGWIALVDGKIAGDAVYQTMAKPGMIELKNLRIDPDYRNRDIGHFLLRQVEVEGITHTEETTNGLTIVTDVSTPNFSGVEFFVRNGFKIVGMDELYTPGQSEYLLQKAA